VSGNESNQRAEESGEFVMRFKPKIIIDSREKTPWVFENLPSERGTLATGDYSVAKLTNLISLERKSLSDLLGCIGRDRERFKKELQRLRAYRFRMLIVEATANDLESGDWRSQLRPSHVLGTLAGWTAQFSQPIWLGGTHQQSGKFAERYLFQCARTIASELEAVKGVA